MRQGVGDVGDGSGVDVGPERCVLEALPRPAEGEGEPETEWPRSARQTRGGIRSLVTVAIREQKR